MCAASFSIDSLKLRERPLHSNCCPLVSAIVSKLAVRDSKFELSGVRRRGREGALLHGAMSAPKNLLHFQGQCQHYLRNSEEGANSLVDTESASCDHSHDGFVCSLQLHEGPSHP